VRGQRRVLDAAAPDPFKGKLHVVTNGATTVCGLDGKKVNTLPPHLAQHATCKRCIAALRA
jgi:hypothetical protein